MDNVRIFTPGLHTFHHFKHKTQETQALTSSRQCHQEIYTLQKYFTTPGTFFATFSKHRTLVLATQTSPPLPVASDQRLWQATHYRQHPNIGFSPLLKELVFIDPDSRIANENTAA